MDLEILKKKVSSFRSDAGRVRNVSDDLLMEILLAWEQRTGPASGFYKALGVSQKGISSIIGKAKKLKREGFPSDGFKEIKIIGENSTAYEFGPTPLGPLRGNHPSSGSSSGLITAFTSGLNGRTHHPPHPTAPSSQNSFPIH